MVPAATRRPTVSEVTVPLTVPLTVPPTSARRTLYVAFELGVTQWKLALTPSAGQPPRLRTLPARDMGVVRDEFTRAKAHFGLSGDAPVMSCYEAGRDGFWLHRALTVAGIVNVVVDSASIEVDRRRRRVKTDRLDAMMLVRMLGRYVEGERQVWSVLHVPSAQDEDRRALHRELAVTTRERTRLRNRIRGLLISQGIVVTTWRDFPAQLAEWRTGDGAPLGPVLKMRLQEEWAALEAVEARHDRLDGLRTTCLRAADGADDPRMAQVRQLIALRAIGIETAWVYVMEFFGWRQFTNGRQVGAAAGLAPTPYASSTLVREQGISKAGNRRIRALAVESAWLWLRYQPQSALSQWYRRRFATGGPRMRRIGIVALARKLLVALWHYLEHGIVPSGATFKEAMAA